MFQRVSFAVAAALTLAAPAMADTDEQMRVVEGVLGDRGFESNGFERHGTLSAGESIRHEVYVSSGRNYFASGVCDNDCSDIDLAIYDKFGNEVGADTQADDFPLVPFRASYTGTYYVEVRMWQCSTSYCYYRTATFGD